MDIQNRLHINNKLVILSSHAIKQAIRRNIHPLIVEATVNGGKIRKLGKNILKVSKRYKGGQVICVGEDVGSQIVIKTIMRSEK